MWIWIINILLNKISTGKSHACFSVYSYSVLGRKNHQNKDPQIRTLQQLLSDIFIFFNVASKSLFLIILQVNTAWGQQIKTGLREQIHPLDSRLKTLYWGIDFGFDLHRVVPEEFSLHCWVPLDGAGSGSFWIFFTILGTQIWRDRLSYLSHGLMPVRGGKEGYIWITDSKA